MRILFIGALAAGLVAATGAPARAQGDGPIEANVPFGFMVGRTAVPAGVYELSSLGVRSPQTMQLRGVGNKVSVLFTVASPSPRGTSPRAELVFDRLGDRYFLAEVDSIDGTEGGRLPVSREEVRLARSGVPSETQRIALARAPKTAATP
jgi:hypothetical protein